MDDLTGGWMVVPRPEYLATAETFEELRQRYAEAGNLPERIQATRQELVELLREHRRQELYVARLQRARKPSEWYLGAVRTEDQERAESLMDGAVAKANSVWAAYEAKLVEFEALAHTLARNFEVVATNRRLLDLTPPNSERIKAEVGQLVGDGIDA